MTSTESGQRPDVIDGLKPDAFYRGPYIARLLGRTWPSFLNARAAGLDLPPATKIGRALWFKGSDVLNWLDSQREAG